MPYKKISMTLFVVILILTSHLCGILQEKSAHAMTVPTVLKQTEIIHTTSTVVEYIPPSKDEVVNEIINQARKYGVSVKDSLEIARCESRYNAFAKSKISTAKGTYQFINKTWTNYCEGDVYDYKANIKCFMELYPKHPTWWECKA